MPTAKKGYYVGKTRVPGVTTILSRFKDSGGLIHWAWQQGVDGKDYRETRDNAASIGNVAHDMVECYIRHVEFNPMSYLPAFVEKATVSFNAFLEWANDSKLEAAETEIQMVSEKYMYG